MEFPEIGSLRVALTGAVLVAVTLALVPPFWLVVRRIFPGRNVFFARWGFIDVARVIVVGLVAAILGRAMFSWIELPLVYGLVTTLFVFGCMSAMCARVATRTEPAGVRALGFESGKSARAIAAGFFLYVAMWPGIVGLSLMAPWVVEIGGGVWEVQSMLPDFMPLDAVSKAGAVVAMVLLIPLFEEVLFRGFLQPLLVQNLREPGGIAMTSLIFAGLHDGSMFLPVFGLSVVLGVIKLRTQRLVACWFVHAAHNAIVLGLYTYSADLRSVLGN